VVAFHDPALFPQCTFIDAESGIGFDPANFRFTRMHEQIQRYLERSGPVWTHLRPSQFMQVYLREPTIPAEGEFFLPLGDAALSPVDLGDRRTPVRRGGRPIRYVDVPREQAWQAWTGAGMPAQRADALSELFAERRRHPGSRVYLGTHEEFGVRPTTFAGFARRHAAAWRGGRVSGSAWPSAGR